MNIYIDESGTFVSAPKLGSWCVVVAVVVPEHARKGIESTLVWLKKAAGMSIQNEIKLKNLQEGIYIEFLSRLSAFEISLFCIATDSGMNAGPEISSHREKQCAEIYRSIEKMRHPEGRSATQHLASQIRLLSDQLYVQLTCQVELLEDVVLRGTNYYAQRLPPTLREFRWRIDQKNTKRTDFEDAFEKIAPALLQTKYFSNPLITVDGFDYSHMEQYQFPEGKLPPYLEEDYGLKFKSAINIQKLIRKNLKFVDSKQVSGVQLADLLASGMRRCLRNEFDQNSLAAQRLGALTIQNSRGNQAVRLITFGDVAKADTELASIVKVMTKNSRPMIL